MILISRQNLYRKSVLSTTLRVFSTQTNSEVCVQPAIATSQSSRGLAPLSVYMQLSKARLSALVVLSSSAGFLLAGAPVAIDALAAVSVGTALQACAANTFNQAYEIKTDAMMGRTRLRPLPSGKITRNHALGFGAATALAGTGVLAAFCNPLTAALGASNVFLYSCVYTPMKQKSIYNTWVGAIVGGIPPLMGYAAATGTILAPEAAILSSALFLWQFPHFFSLAWLSKKDYAAGGHKMVPCFDPLGVETGKLLTKYSLAMSTLPIAAYSLGTTSVMFPLESIAFNGYLVYSAYKFREDPSNSNARRVFRTSLWYLPLFMALMIFHKNGWSNDETTKSFVFSASDSNRPNPGNSMGDIAAMITDAKAYMKSVCIHEIMSPRHNAIVKNTALEQQPLCPVTSVSNTISDVK